MVPSVPEPSFQTPTLKPRTSKPVILLRQKRLWTSELRDSSDLDHQTLVSIRSQLKFMNQPYRRAPPARSLVSQLQHDCIVDPSWDWTQKPMPEVPLGGSCCNLAMVMIHRTARDLTKLAKTVNAGSHHSGAESWGSKPLPRDVRHQVRPRVVHRWTITTRATK